MRGWLIGVMLGIAGSVCAATAATEAGGVFPGSVSALEFRLDGNFSIAPLVGTSLSWKHYGEDRRGWRLGLTPSYSTESYDSEFAEHTDRMYGLTVECQRLGFMASRSAARPYWGLGVLAGAERWEREYFREPTDDAVISSDRSSTTYRAGLVGTLGAEFTIAEKLVIGAEYSITATWSRERRVDLDRDDIIEESSDRRYTGTSYGLNSRPVALTIAILF